MPRAWFRFYAELNDLLLPERRLPELAYDFLDAATVKDRIESVGQAAHRGRSRDRQRRVARLRLAGRGRRPHQRVPGLRVARHCGADAAASRAAARASLRSGRPLGDARGVPANGRLRHLYRNCYSDDELASISSGEHRILLTRDVGLLKRREVTHGCFVRKTAPRRQIREVVRRLDLGRLLRPFTRCMRCNDALRPASRDEAAVLLPRRIAAFHDEFQRCPQCGRVYWKGGHHRRMQTIVEELGLHG